MRAVNDDSVFWMIQSRRRAAEFLVIPYLPNSWNDCVYNVCVMII